MTGWRKQLRAGRFRKAGFFVESHSADVAGRRIALHEYPGRDQPWPEDMGRKTRGFTIEAYVIGTDYMAARDALIAACNEAGPGQLVHPYLGTRSVICEDCQVSETTQDGGMARFSLSFVEAGENIHPRAVPEPGAAVTRAADQAIEVTVESFGKHFSINKAPQFVIDDARAWVEKISRSFNIPDLPSLDIPDLLSEPRRLARWLINQISDPLRLPANPFWGTRRGGTPKMGNQSNTTPSRRRLIANHQALNSLVKRSEIIGQARSAITRNYQHRGEALAMRNHISKRIESEMYAASRGQDDPAFETFRTLNTVLVADLNARAPSLSQTTTLTPKQAEPALVTSYRIYADAGRADEIISRNRIIHPGFIPADRPLEILTHA